MIKIENTATCNWEAAIRGMRNPMNSWEKADSLTAMDIVDCTGCPHNQNDQCGIISPCFNLGPNDKKLAMQLARAGTEHSKYRRMIIVSMDILAPLYWWKEFDTYKVGTVANSCSTMHKIHAKEFVEEDFSFETIEKGIDEFVGDDAMHCAYCCTQNTISNLNRLRYCYLTASKRLEDDGLSDAERKHIERQKGYYWKQMIELLPSSYNQLRTITTNYETLAAMYRQRKNHKLDEWHVFCDMIRTLPYSELITLEEGRDDEC